MNNQDQTQALQTDVVITKLARMSQKLKSSKKHLPSSLLVYLLEPFLEGCSLVELEEASSLCQNEDTNL